MRWGELEVGRHKMVCTDTCTPTPSPRASPVQPPHGCSCCSMSTSATPLPACSSAMRWKASASGELSSHSAQFSMSEGSGLPAVAYAAARRGKAGGAWAWQCAYHAPALAPMELHSETNVAAQGACHRVCTCVLILPNKPSKKEAFQSPCRSCFPTPGTGRPVATPPSSPVSSVISPADM